VDVEPAGFQLDGPDPAQWDGFAATTGLVEELRAGLTARTGRRPVVGWYHRMDPQITAVYGRPDHAIRTFPESVTAQRARGDYFGLHVHPVRRGADGRAWVHDFGDPATVTGTVEHCADAFTAALGESPRRHRGGLGGITEAMVTALDHLGITVDLSMERSRGDLTEVRSGVDVSPVLGRTADCTGAPRAAYRPRIGEFAPPGGVPTDEGHRRVTLVPLTTTTRGRLPRRPGRLVRRLLGHRPGPRVMFPNLAWPGPRWFWDLALREAERMERPYLSFAIRTDAPDSVPSRQAAAVLRALPDHPIADRIDLVDPLTVLADLVPPD